MNWVKTGLLRTDFTQGALYEIGAAITLFRVKKHDQEFLAALDSNLKRLPETAAEEIDAAEIAEDEPDAERYCRAVYCRTKPRTGVLLPQ